MKYRALKGKIPHLYIIGDAKKADNIMPVIQVACEIGRNI